RRDTLRGVLEGEAPDLLARWRSHQAAARAATGELSPEGWVHYLVAATGLPLPAGVEVRLPPRLERARARGDAGVLAEDAAGAGALAWALQLAGSVDDPVESWFPVDRVAFERLVARADLRRVEPLRKERDALRRKQPAAAAMLRRVLHTEPEGPEEGKKRVYDEEHCTWHRVEVSSARYRQPRRREPEPPPPEEVHEDLLVDGDQIELHGFGVISLSALVEETWADSELPWVCGLRPGGDDFLLQEDGKTVRVWQVTDTHITKVADSGDDLHRMLEEDRSVQDADVRRGEAWVRVVFGGPGPVRLDLTGEHADLLDVLGHEDTELDGTTLILPILD
ncbi:MAG: hypothetical protein KC656_23010, partial [Myxococcales bacterium]|nr:hypothetical protein [Myxococcales bacterium]